MTHLPYPGGWKAESTYALQSVYSPCPKLRIAVIFVKTQKLFVRSAIQSGDLSSHRQACYHYIAATCYAHFT